MSARSSRTLTATYWFIVAILVAVGIVAWSSFGQAAVLLAVVLMALGPLRHEPAAFWPLVAGAMVFVGGYALAAPVNCRTGAISQVGGPQLAGRFCDSVLGFGYVRTGSSDPSQFPAFAGALVTGLLAAGIVRLVFRRRGAASRVEAEEAAP